MKKHVFWALSLLLVFPWTVYSYDYDDISQVKTPNVMIIFDTSNSMDMQPNGLSQAAGNATGIDGKTYNFEAGGNHPGSKLYQAKKALKEIVESVVKDKVNLGFSTYGQLKTEKRRAKYQRDRRNYTTPTTDKWKWKKLYWRFNNYRHGPWSTVSFAKDSFTDAWSILRTAVTVGYTTPLILGPPAFKFPDDKFPKKYSTFKGAWTKPKREEDRETVIYVGANDGMLHAFDKDGNEKYAFLPKNTLGKLKELRGKDHQFFVDSSPRMSDAYVQGGWRTVILSGERGGGNSYFCLDATDPGDPIIMWEKSDPAMGNTWSRPEIGWVRIGGQEKFVAFVGGGYSETDDVGNTFYVLDMEDGAILRKFAVPPGGDKKNKVAAGATAFDSDSDGRVDGVYFGDTSGVLWKIKIDLEEDVSKWALIKLFDPGTKHPIFYPPAVTKNNQKKILVYFGQGDELNIYEDTIANSFFEIWDKGASGELSWERKLEKGEKVLASPAFANNIIYFTTFKYTGIVDNCGAGIGRIYGLTGTRDGIPGNQAALYLNPLTGEPFKDPKDYITITDYFPKEKGIPSAPVIVVTPKYTYYYFSTSSSKKGDRGVNLPASQARLKYWREVF